MNPQDIVQQWQNNTTAAVDKWAKAVQAVKTAPGELAAQAVGKYQTGVNNAVSSGRYEKNSRAVSLSDWQARTVAKKSNIATGVREASSRFMTFVQSSIPFWQQLSNQIQAMPNNSIDDGLNRVRTAVTAMKQQYGKS